MLQLWLTEESHIQQPYRHDRTMPYHGLAGRNVLGVAVRWRAAVSQTTHHMSTSVAKTFQGIHQEPGSEPVGVPCNQVAVAYIGKVSSLPLLYRGMGCAAGRDCHLIWLRHEQRTGHRSSYPSHTLRLCRYGQSSRLGSKRCHILTNTDVLHSAGLLTCFISEFCYFPFSSLSRRSFCPTYRL